MPPQRTTPCKFSVFPFYYCCQLYVITFVYSIAEEIFLLKELLLLILLAFSLPFYSSKLMFSLVNNLDLNQLIMPEARVILVKISAYV